MPWNQAPISKRFRDIQLQSACPMQILIAHARYHVTCTPCVKFGYIFEFFTHTLPFHTFIGLRWRIRGVYSWDPNVKREIEQKFSKSKNLPNFDLLGGLGVRVFKIFRFFLQKAHPCVNPRYLSHFAWRSVEGSDPQACSWKKVRKSQILP